MNLFLYILFILICFWLLLKDWALYRARNAFLIGFFLYKGIGFLDYFGQNEIRMSEDLMFSQLLLSISLVFGIWVGEFFFYKGRYYSLHSELVSLSIKPLPPLFVSGVSIVMVMVGLFAYTLLIQQAYGGISNMISLSRTKLFAEKDGLGLLSLGLNIAITGCLFKIVYYFCFKNIQKLSFPFFFVGVIFLLLALELRLGNRGTVLLFLFPLSYFFLLKKPVLNRVFVLALPIGIIVMQYVGIARTIVASGGMTVGEYLEQTNYEQLTNLSTFGEFLAQQKIDNHIFKQWPHMEPMMGKTYLDVLINFLPSFIYPERPDLPSLWYVKTYFPEIYEVGGGLAFSIVSEGIINFGYLGPFVLGMFMAFLFYKLEMQLLNSRTFLSLIIYIITLYFFFYFTRSGISTLVKPWVFGEVLPLLLTYGFFYIIFRRLSS